MGSVRGSVLFQVRGLKQKLRIREKRGRQEGNHEARSLPDEADKRDGHDRDEERLSGDRHHRRCVLLPVPVPLRQGTARHAPALRHLQDDGHQILCRAGNAQRSSGAAASPRDRARAACAAAGGWCRCWCWGRTACSSTCGSRALCSPACRVPRRGEVAQLRWAPG